MGRNALNCALYLEFNENLNPLNLESKIRDTGDIFTLKLYESFLNYIDDKFKNSKDRKLIYNIKKLTRELLLLPLDVSQLILPLILINKLKKDLFF